MKKIIIPDYGSGNYASIVRMVEKVGGHAEILKAPRILTRDERIILAGVGAFDYGMSQLHSFGWLNWLRDEVENRGTPVLGICLGMQLMCKSSEEGTLPGLGWIDATVRQFKFPENSKLKVPHMGWNTLNIIRKNPLLPISDEEQRFYFVHSYYVDCTDEQDVVATCEYGHKFVAALNRTNIFGVQFHPEKSHRFGMKLIESFWNLDMK